MQLKSLLTSFKDHFFKDVSLGEVVKHLRLLTKGQILFLDQVVKLAQCCLAMSASNATSAMRRTTTILRNSMSQNRLIHTMDINVNSEKVNSIDLK